MLLLLLRVGSLSTILNFTLLYTVHISVTDYSVSIFIKKRSLSIYSIIVLSRLLQ